MIVLFQVDGSDAQVEAEYCHMYASVMEDSRPRMHPVCADNVREQLIYTSGTNSVTLELMEQIINDPSINFLIKYEGKLSSIIIIMIKNHITVITTGH